MYILFHHPIEKLELQTSWGGQSFFLIPEGGGQTLFLTVEGGGQEFFHMF